jgi:hypothetical protein
MSETPQQNLQQINITYNPIEDRMLFKLRAGNNQEYRLWFTRRFTRILMKLLLEKMNTFGGADSIAVSNDTQQDIKNGALSKKYVVPEVPEYPLGESGIIPSKMNVSELKNGGIVVQFSNNANKGMKLNMDKKMLFMVHNLLVQCITKAEWNLELEQSLSNCDINVH